NFLDECTHKLGPVVRVAPYQYSIDDPGVIKTIYGIGKGFPKVVLRFDFAPNPPWCDLFTDGNSARHAANRRIVANLYSVTTLKDMEPEVEDCIRQFVSRLTHLSKSGRILDLQFWMQCYAFDVISQITVGFPISWRLSKIILTFLFTDSLENDLGFSIPGRTIWACSRAFTLISSTARLLVLSMNFTAPFGGLLPNCLQPG
ncbi:cytochrome P450 oxidoreductase, partial [Colletotrichum asianum]